MFSLEHKTQESFDTIDNHANRETQWIEECVLNVGLDLTGQQHLHTLLAHDRLDNLLLQDHFLCDLCE